MRSQEHKGLLQALDSTQALGLRAVSSCIESTQMARTSQEYRGLGLRTEKITRKS